jgi:HTH-type transcriptional regulator / antitoxin HigA
MTPTAFRYEPEHALPTGATLQEVLEEQGMTQSDLATRTGLSTKHVNQIIKGTAPVTA